MNIISIDETNKAMRAALKPGDDVLIHSSLSELGHFEQGLPSLIHAMRNAVTAEGTIVMMTATRSFAKTQEFSINQPSETGILTEEFRKMENVKRSCVPMVSFCAWGARANEYLQQYHSLLDASSPMVRLLENDAKVMMLGVGYEKATFYHLSEERNKAPYNDYKEFKGYLVEGETRTPISQRYFVRRDMSVKKDPAAAVKILKERNATTEIALGKGKLCVFKAREFDDCCMQALEENPHAFLISSPTDY
ncbi:MAG: AAC(3) family N-acetyltransferase [Rickettsiales bacterium]|nr:AAC(3) family N-acetyltransferase [Rickettsiales bacterium]